MPEWVDPRTNPKPPYSGPKRALAKGPEQIAELVALCKAGQLYEVEGWVASGYPLQAKPPARGAPSRKTTPLGAAIAAGNLDLVHLLLCNGYRLELEPRPPLEAALQDRRWDIVDLLLDWGADPASADPGTILDTYERRTFERFWSMGVDLTQDGAMAYTLAASTRNRPLYGFVKNYRERDPRIQRALDLALGKAIEDRNARAVSLCVWAGANPRQRIGDIDQEPEDDDEGFTAIERAVFRGAHEYLKPLRFDPVNDEIQSLYPHVWDVRMLEKLVALEPPRDWETVTWAFAQRFAWSVHFGLRSRSVSELETVFNLGGRLGALDRDAKRELRRLLLSLGGYDAQRLFQLLARPENMNRAVFIDLIGHQKLAAVYSEAPRRYGLDKGVLSELLAAKRVPAPVRRWARSVLHPERPVVQETYLEPVGGSPRLYSREELYELVWSEPVVTLARRFGLSDNGLRKRCKAMHVPTPPPGYWRRVERGIRVQRAPLPAIEP